MKNYIRPKGYCQQLFKWNFCVNNENTHRWANCYLGDLGMLAGTAIRHLREALCYTDVQFEVTSLTKTNLKHVKIQRKTRVSLQLIFWQIIRFVYPQ